MNVEVYSGDSADVWVVLADGRPYLLNHIKIRYEDLGFKNIEEVDNDPYFGPVQRFTQED